MRQTPAEIGKLDHPRGKGRVDAAFGQKIVHALEKIGNALDALAKSVKRLQLVYRWRSTECAGDHKISDKLLQVVNRVSQYSQFAAYAGQNLPASHEGLTVFRTHRPDAFT
ncbi:MAG: hypothetical protein ABL907_01105 [Hyphomicrobium sp.]